MRKNILIFSLLITCNSFASISLETKVKKVLSKNITANEIVDLSVLAKKELKKKQSDESYYFAYDLHKTLEVAASIKVFNAENCTMAKNQIFRMYGIKSIESSKSDMPKGADVGMVILSKACSK